MEYLTIFFATLLSLVLFYFLYRSNNGLPTNWPVVGTLFALIKNNQRIHQFVFELIEKSQKTTFYLKGPWFSNMDILFTVDPADIDHVFSKNFSNYGKGQNFLDIFEFFGDGFSNSDDALWQYHRKLNHSFLGHPKFRSTFVNTVQDEIDCRLIPLFDHVSKNDIEIDLQDVFIRFTFDVICTILTNDNPKFLSIDLPPVPFLKAIAGVEEEIFKRHLLPTYIWKALRWLGVGEKKHNKDCDILDDFLYTSIAKWRSNKAKNEDVHNDNDDDVEVSSFDLLKYMDEDINAKAPSDKRNDTFLRDTILGIITAGGNTTSVALSWFFYNLLKFPQVLSNIRDEINTTTIVTNSSEEITIHKKSQYLHAAICETLRLYPPVAYNHKASITSDTLPSGHQIHPNTLMLFDVYTMGRMKSIWGDDCNEFKPERWITKRGNIEVLPSSKFLSFGAGPRVCQGKDTSMTQMKVVIAAIVSRYEVELVKGHQVVPDELSVFLYLKHGLKVKIKPRLY